MEGWIDGDEIFSAEGMGSTSTTDLHSIDGALEHLLKVAYGLSSNKSRMRLLNLHDSEKKFFAPILIGSLAGF